MEVLKHIDKFLTALAQAHCPKRSDILVTRYLVDDGPMSRITIILAKTAQATWFDIDGSKPYNPEKTAKAIKGLLDGMTKPIEGEMNSDHPVTAGMRDQWHKIVALLMLRKDERHIEIPLAEMERMLLSEDINVVVEPKVDRLILRLLSKADAMKLFKNRN